jgi:ABC-type glycerol-3-phosphate transport system substrate-binding protein
VYTEEHRGGAGRRPADVRGITLKKTLFGICKKTMLISAVLAVATLALTACSGGGGGDDAEDTYYTLQVLSPLHGQIEQSLIGTAFKSGTKITLTANPDEDYDFVRWTNDGANSTENPLTVTISKNTIIGAEFADMCELKVSAVVEGTG